MSAGSAPVAPEGPSGVLPALVEDYVRPGKLRIVFRGLAFIGPDSEAASAGADPYFSTRGLRRVTDDVRFGATEDRRTNDDAEARAPRPPTR